MMMLCSVAVGQGRAQVPGSSCQGFGGACGVCSVSSVLRGGVATLNHQYAVRKFMKDPCELADMALQDNQPATK